MVFGEYVYWLVRLFVMGELNDEAKRRESLVTNICVLWINR